jgi:hypothetical protein
MNLQPSVGVGVGDPVFVSSPTLTPTPTLTARKWDGMIRGPPSGV